jgi:predicted metalloprotease with PDZ domain
MREMSGGFSSFELVCAVLTAWLTLGATSVLAQSVEYRLSFPDAIHHVMQVEATFHDVTASPLLVQMSRSSAGRYAAFEFAENVFGEEITDGSGKPLTVKRPDPRTWEISGQRDTVHISYHVFGDRVDGTFLAVDSTHAHINFPAALMWAHGLEDRPVRVIFVPPAASDWKVATQLYSTDHPLVFTAPNLQYLMDSPVELSHFAMTLRARSNSRVTLDDFMRAMWRVHGKPGGAAPGLVSQPYTMADVRARLAEVSGDQAFADDFVHRYSEGTEKMDLAPLLLRAGFILRKKGGDATLGGMALQKRGDGLQVVSSSSIGSPAYLAGLDLDDQLISVAGVTLASPEDLSKALAGRKPGDNVELVFKRRGQEVHTLATLAEDPQLELVPIETVGGTLSQEQRQFREAWLSSEASHS